MRINLGDDGVLPPERDANQDRRAPAGADDECLVCNRPVVGARCAWVEMLVDLTVLIDEGPREGDADSQGNFPVGRDCFARIRRLARESSQVSTSGADT